MIEEAQILSRATPKTESPLHDLEGTQVRPNSYAAQKKTNKSNSAAKLTVHPIPPSEFAPARSIIVLRGFLGAGHCNVHDGPGLNAGYSSQGVGGLNAGMEAREAYMPKSVDDLRVATNPKLEYNLDNHQGPASSGVKNIGMMGKMEQHKPDTFYAQSEDRWLKTTSEVKAQTSRPTQEVHDTARMHSKSYTGH